MMTEDEEGIKEFGEALNKAFEDLLESALRAMYKHCTEENAEKLAKYYVKFKAKLVEGGYSQTQAMLVVLMNKKNIEDIFKGVADGIGDKMKELK